MDYDVSKAFKRIENDLIKSMMRNFDKHRAEETAEGINWTQWQAEQLKELERYRKENAKRFPEQFAEINQKIDELYRKTAKDAQSKEEEKILEQIKKGNYKPPSESVSFFGINDQKLTALIESTHADFIRAEYAVLRQANDQYRKIIFDAQMYSATGAGYAQSVDMATKDFLKAGIQSVVYKNGAKHTISNYAEMAIRTGQKRAYLMGEGNAHDKYGIHTVRVKKRANACPLCLPFGGKVLVDDVYGGGTAQEARELKVPTLSQAIAQGFLHPNCKDIYSLYIEGVSRPAERWKKEEVDDIVDNYNQEQELNHARDMEESYSRMAEYSLDPSNKQTYEARAKQWSDRVAQLENGEEPIVEEPKPKASTDFGAYTQNEKDAIEHYVSGDGMWINQYLRGNGDFGELSPSEKDFLNDLLQATSKEIPKGFNGNKLYRSVDASVLLKGAGVRDKDIDLVYELLKYPNDKDLAKYAQKQGLFNLKDKPIGFTYTEKGFMSTTTDFSIASEFNDLTGAEHPIVLKFDTSDAKNLLGADAREFDIPEDPQKEILLHPDTRYTVENIHLEESEEYGRILVADAKLLGVEDTEIAETIAGTVAEPSAPVFVPAHTIEEAERFAKDTFIDESRFLALGTSYDGVSLDIANKVNETLFNFYQTYDIDKFGGIIAPKGNTKLGKIISDATAGYHKLAHSFLLNRKTLKDIATAEKALLRERTIITDFLKNPQKYDLSKVSSLSRMVIENSAISGRSTVPMTVEEVLWHELGHSLERKLRDVDNFDLIKANMEQYAPHISGYSTSSFSEYIAESFCSYQKGEGLVDPELIRGFDQLRRK